MNRRFHKPSTHVDYAQRPNLIKHINHETNTIWRAAPMSIFGTKIVRPL